MAAMNDCGDDYFAAWKHSPGAEVHGRVKSVEMLTSKFTSDDGTTRPDYPCVGLELKDGGGLSWHVSSLGARRAVACDGPQAERGDRSPGASAAAAGHRPRRGVFDVTLIVTAEQIGF